MSTHTHEVALLAPGSARVLIRRALHAFIREQRSKLDDLAAYPDQDGPLAQAVALDLAWASAMADDLPGLLHTTRLREFGEKPATLDAVATTWTEAISR